MHFTKLPKSLGKLFLESPGNFSGTESCFMFVVMLLAMKSPLKSSRPQKYFPNFHTQKLPEWNILNPKNSFDYPRHLKSGVPPPTGARNCATKHFPSFPKSYGDFRETGLKCFFSSISNDPRKFFGNVGEPTFGSCKSFQMFSF